MTAETYKSVDRRNAYSRKPRREPTKMADKDVVERITNEDHARSPGTARAIEDAMRGLSRSAQQRFAIAWQNMRRDWETQMKAALTEALEESWTDYLCRIAPTIIKRIRYCSYTAC